MIRAIIFILLTMLQSYGLISCATHIHGKITGDNGRPLQGLHGKVNIQGLDRNNQNVTEIVSIDNDGSFKNDADLVVGRYLVEALIPGYQSESMTVTIKKSQEVKLSVQKLSERKTNLIDLQDQSRLDRGAGNVTLTPPEF